MNYPDYANSHEHVQLIANTPDRNTLKNEIEGKAFFPLRDWPTYMKNASTLHQRPIMEPSNSSRFLRKRWSAKPYHIFTAPTNNTRKRAKNATTKSNGFATTFTQMSTDGFTMISNKKDF